MEGRVVVVGAGASGMAAALAAGASGARGVVLLEALAAPGRSVLRSGNGRCNFANADLSPERYNAPAFVARAMGDDPLAPVLEMFESLGLWYVSDGQGRLFPRSRAASSVLDALLDGLREQGARVQCGSRVVRAEPGPAGRWALEVEGSGAVEADALVWAAGGGSAGALAAGTGLAVVPERPALCPLACSPRLPKALDGVRAACAVELRGPRGEFVAREEGEVLFRRYGLSGIAVFDLSRLARRGDAAVVDLVPDVSEEELARVLERRAARLSARLAAPEGRLAFLDGALHPALARFFMEGACGAAGERRVDARRLARSLKGWELAVEGPAGEGQAQVVQGGLELSSFDPATLAAKGARGLFACGEALDVDGACGGYNLAWAWSSGMVAGVSAARAVLGGRDGGRDGDAL